MDINDNPSEGKTLDLKHLAIIAGGVVVAAVIVVAAVRLIRGGGDRLAVEAPALKTPVDRQQAALETGNAALCGDRQGDEYDACVFAVADQNGDPEACAKLSDPSDARLCADTLHLRRAFASGGEPECDKITDEPKRQACRETVRGPLTAENCASRGAEPDECQMFAVAEQAAAKKDRRLCEALEDPWTGSCIDLVPLDDPDGDGLSTEQEMYEFGSDPRNADTDRDGYNDGDEVAAGYSPTGPEQL